MLLLCERYLKYNNPVHPITMVTSNWLILPTRLREIAFILFSSSTYNILPPYSPIRLGVSMVTLQPDNTDLNARIKENRCTWLINICHFLDSMPQLTNINNITSQNFQFFQPLLICAHLCGRSGWLIICLYKLHESIRKSTGPKK